MELNRTKLEISPMFTKNTTSRAGKQFRFINSKSYYLHQVNHIEIAIGDKKIVVSKMTILISKSKHQHKPGYASAPKINHRPMRQQWVKKSNLQTNCGHSIVMLKAVIKELFSVLKFYKCILIVNSLIVKKLAPYT